MLLQFERSLTRINTFMKFIGLSIDSDDSNKTMLERLRHHWVYFIHMISFTISLLGQFAWLAHSLIYGATLLELTYLLPCLTLCLLGHFKVYFFIRYIHHVNDLVEVLRKLQSYGAKYKDEQLKGIKKWVTYLSAITKLLLSLTVLAVVAFGFGPFVITVSYYSITGKLKLFLPFIVWYPFDSFNVRIWPFVYLHQLWSAWVCVFSVLGPDCFFYTCCTFIKFQFLILNNDLKLIVNQDLFDQSSSAIDIFKRNFVELVNQHRDLIRCVNLLELIYSKSTLFNVITSYVIICATGFNLLVIENYGLMALFTSFLSFGLLQIFLYCCYSDHVMRSSMGVGDAVYKSQWYKTGATQRKYLLIVLIRSQTPCKLTAYGFTDMNLRTFTRILSTSWSYFALLQQVYHD